jgi:hypothetical protein
MTRAPKEAHTNEQKRLAEKFARALRKEEPSAGGTVKLKAKAGPNDCPLMLVSAAFARMPNSLSTRSTPSLLSAG